MGLKKKKNVIVLTVIVIVSFILYQLYFFLAITSDASDTAGNIKYVPVLDHSKLDQMKVMRSTADRYIDEHGLIRGVFARDMRLYAPDKNKEFKCLTSHQKVLYERINDDYCDCDDGSDEPSTNACANGTFYCQSAKMKVKSSVVTIVPSGMVNDGICDCCDGSDEWLHHPNQKLLSQHIKKRRHYVTTCPNIC